MKYDFKENRLTYDDYCALRESVGWKNFSKEQTENAIKKSWYTVTAYNDEKAIGMARAVGDGIYFTIVDVIVMPEY